MAEHSPRLIELPADLEIASLSPRALRHLQEYEASLSETEAREHLVIVLCRPGPAAGHKGGESALPPPMEFFAWVEPQAGSCVVASYQTPAGLLPAFAAEPERLGGVVAVQMQNGANRTGQPRQLVRFVAESVLQTVEPEPVS